jgi:hypothetical protein
MLKMHSIDNERAYKQTSLVVMFVRARTIFGGKFLNLEKSSLEIRREFSPLCCLNYSKTGGSIEFTESPRSRQLSSPESHTIVGGVGFSFMPLNILI